MVDDRSNEFAKLLNFLGVEWEASALDYRAPAFNRGHVRTPSYAQIMEPINSDAVARWERYRTLLEPAFPTLAPWVVKHGYSELAR